MADCEELARLSEGKEDALRDNRWLRGELDRANSLLRAETERGVKQAARIVALERLRWEVGEHLAYLTIDWWLAVRDAYNKCTPGGKELPAYWDCVLKPSKYAKGERAESACQPEPEPVPKTVCNKCGGEGERGIVGAYHVGCPAGVGSLGKFVEPLKPAPVKPSVAPGLVLHTAQCRYCGKTLVVPCEHIHADAYYCSECAKVHHVSPKPVPAKPPRPPDGFTARCSLCQTLYPAERAGTACDVPGNICERCGGDIEPMFKFKCDACNTVYVPSAFNAAGFRHREVNLTSGCDGTFRKVEGGE